MGYCRFARPKLHAALLMFGLWGCISAVAAPATIADLQDAMRNGQTSSERLVAEALAAIARHRSLNAFISVDDQGALQRARQLDRMRAQGQILGPLHGIPIAVKDNIHVAGLPNTAGTPLLESFVPIADAPAVARLKEAGAIVLGKTNMHELAFGITSNNAAFGPVGNARNGKFIAGGSSGGTAVAIASGMAIAGLGTDTGGSSRIPAALNGIAGFRPTTGRYPSAGLTRISHTRDTVGPMAGRVTDLALLDGLMAATGPMAESESLLPTVSLEGVRLGVPREHFFANLETAIGAAMQDLLARLEAAGADLVHADLHQVSELNHQVSLPTVLFESGPLLEDYLSAHRPGMNLSDLARAIASPDVRDLIAQVAAHSISESAYRQAIDIYRPRLRAAYANHFNTHRVEAIVFPTTVLTARPIREATDTVELNGAPVPTFATYIQNTDPGSNAGVPGLSIPLAMAKPGMPAGVEIDGPEHSDRRLLGIGAAIERLIRSRGATPGSNQLLNQGDNHADSP